MTTDTTRVAGGPESMIDRQPRSPMRRELGIDLARGVALISMFVAHTAPSAGPLGLLQVSEYLTFPLFALLVGAGAALGARAYAPAEHAVRTLVQAGALLGVGRWLEGEGAQIVIVLAPLGVLTLLAWGLARLPWWAVSGVGLAAAAVAPWTLEASRETALRLMHEESAWQWWFGLLVSPSYPMAVLVTMACLGILLVRFLLPAGNGRVEAGGSGEVSRWGSPPLRTWTTAAATLVVAAVLLAMTVLDRIDIAAYVTAPAEQVLISCLAVGVTALCLGVSQWSGRIWGWCVGAVASAGSLTLTLYTLHVLWLAWWVSDFRPGERDDAWVNVVGMTLFSLVFAVVWRRVPWPGIMARGPLEGVVVLTSGVLARLLPRRFRSGGGESR